MRFKTFLKLMEDGQGGEQGLMVNKPSKTRKPSDGHKNAQRLSSFNDGSGGNSGGNAQPMFMKKK